MKYLIPKFSQDIFKMLISYKNCGDLDENTQVKQDRNTAAYFFGFGNFKNLLS